jgi:hypothetical protein
VNPALVPLLVAGAGLPAVVGGVALVARWSVEKAADEAAAAIAAMEAERHRRAELDAARRNRRPVTTSTRKEIA